MGNIRVVSTLSEALADTVSSVGFTRRAGGARVTHACLRELITNYPDVLPRLDDELELQAGEFHGAVTAMVFGYALLPGQIHVLHPPKTEECTKF